MSLALNKFLSGEGKVQEPTTQVVEDVEQPKVESPKEPVVVDEVAYKELQSFATINRQELIRTSIEFARAKPESILDIKDKKLQDKVVESLYPSYKNVDELQLVNGKEFWKETPSTEEIGEDIPTPSTSIEKELKLIKHQLAKKELSDAISEFKRLNPHLVINEDKEEKLREEISNISVDLSSSERVARAGKIIFGNNVENGALLALQSTTNTPASSGNSIVGVENKNKDSEKQNALRDFLGLQKK